MEVLLYGAAVIELNPSYPGKKQKQYIAYRTDVIDMHRLGKNERCSILTKQSISRAGLRIATTSASISEADTVQTPM